MCVCVCVCIYIYIYIYTYSRNICIHTLSVSYVPNCKKILVYVMLVQKCGDYNRDTLAAYLETGYCIKTEGCSRMDLIKRKLVSSGSGMVQWQKSVNVVMDVQLPIKRGDFRINQMTSQEIFCYMSLVW